MASNVSTPWSWQAVGAQLVDQADAAPLLREVDQQAVSVLRDLRDGAAQLVAAIAAQASQEVAGEAFGVQPRQHRAIARRLADDDGKMLGPAVSRPKGDHPRILRARQGTRASLTIRRPRAAAS